MGSLPILDESVKLVCERITTLPVREEIYIKPGVSKSRFAHQQDPRVHKTCNNRFSLINYSVANPDSEIPQDLRELKNAIRIIDLKSYGVAAKPQDIGRNLRALAVAANYNTGEKRRSFLH
tara:strand:- start:471 stop:833 length:363 start_codon:yes stop_codon:yes gene_type:complete